MSADGGSAAPTSGRRGISRWSIEHPYVLLGFYLGVAILSVLVIFFQTPRRMTPYVEGPIVGLVSMMPGRLSAKKRLLGMPSVVQPSRRAG